MLRANGKIVKLMALRLTVLSVAHDPDWVALCGRVFDLEAGNMTEEKGNGDA